MRSAGCSCTSTAVAREAKQPLENDRTLARRILTIVTQPKNKHRGRWYSTQTAAAQPASAPAALRTGQHVSVGMTAARQSPVVVGPTLRLTYVFSARTLPLIIRH